MAVLFNIHQLIKKGFYINYLFKYDNKFFDILGKITDVVILNLLFIISCLLIITIGDSTTATYSVAKQMVKDKESYIIKKLVKKFKENFKTNTIVWIGMIIIGCALAFNLYMSKIVLNKSISMVLQFLFTMISIIYIFKLTYVFPLISKFENTIKNTMINSILISI